jgi:hypothetical protein
VYLWRTLRFEERHRVVCPGSAHVRFCLLLARAHPWRVILLRNSNARVTQQDGNAFNRNTGQEQFDRKSVSEPMRVTVRKFGFFKKGLELGLPVSGCRL